MLKVPKKIFGPRELFLTYRVSRIEYTAENTIRGPNISLGTFNTVQYTL